MSEIPQSRSMDRDNRQSHTAEGDVATSGREPRVKVAASSDVNRWPWLGAAPKLLAQALIFGTAFGFLLQKGGVAKFDLLIGALLLESFVVEQVMLSAILVGMVGVFLLDRMQLLDLQIKDTVLGANIVGGLIFGVGFGMLAYCPGTDAAAVGQGNLDALVGILGMTAGSYLFALSSRWTATTIGSWGKLGKITLAEWTGVSRSTFIALAVPALAAVLVLIELFAP